MTPCNTLVIGGAGFIGTHLVPGLLATGRSVTILDKRGAAQRELPEGVSFVQGDFNSPEIITELMECHEEVIHLAYGSVPNTSFDDPLADLLENLPPTLRLFQEAAAKGCKVVFLSSGGTVYGEAIELPIPENHPAKPISPYGVTKLTLENYAHLYGVTHGLKYVCLRPANAYGPGQMPFAGQGFVATAMASAMRGDTVRIFGREGTIRDYIYVSDLVSGIVQALEKGRLWETYNIGSGQGRSNMDVIKAISRVLGEEERRAYVEHLPERSFDVKANVLDSTKLQRDTGWGGRVEFTEGLLRTYTWLKKYHD